MAIIVLTSAGGSPGVTSTALGLSLTWPRMTGAGAVAGLITGAVVVIAWIALGLSGTLYEIVPGFIASWIAIVVVSRATPDLGEYRAPKSV